MAQYGQGGYGGGQADYGQGGYAGKYYGLMLQCHSNDASVSVSNLTLVLVSAITLAPSELRPSLTLALT